MGAGIFPVKPCIDFGSCDLRFHPYMLRRRPEFVRVADSLEGRGSKSTVNSIPSMAFYVSCPPRVNNLIVLSHKSRRKFYSSGRTPLIDEAVPDLDPVNLSTPPFSGIKVTLDFGSHCYSLLLDDVGNSVSGADEATDRPHFKRRGVKRSLFIEDA
nr:hypothetical protein Itr_chr03CG16450 [Ipomoea trifida]